MLRFQSDDDFVEIDLIEQVPAGQPDTGNAQLSVRVSSAGFAGHSQSWVELERLQSFCRGLVALGRVRRGEAAIESMSPKELILKIRSSDLLGHMSIEGSTGRGVFQLAAETWWAWHAVHFGFEFDPSQLVAAIRVDWVKRNAET